ncbi:hypothetical protein M9H77_09143 [Catharanthus roseus]|uniref:Uncharacterized protein n=1 Tax=Catharanthus roseus TaxID=4058 RepID=A0ACC0C086_CATRO|nr:hypothetical protein M9H77_09143 [Catharanthus roseus]
MASQPPNGYLFNHKIYARVRLATDSDVPHLYKLMYHMALLHNVPFDATVSSISNNLFKSNPLPPFQSLTALILEVSPNPFPNISNHPIFNPIVKTIDLEKPIIDKESELFRSSSGKDDDDDDFFIGGYVLFFPSYFSVLKNPGIFVDHLYVRKCYRELGFGEIMYSLVASYAAKKGYSMVDQVVAPWNVNILKLLEKMGVKFVEGLRLHRLSGKELEAHANDFPIDKNPNISSRL